MGNDVAEGMKFYERQQKLEQWKLQEEKLREHRERLQALTGEAIPDYDAFKQQREQEAQPAHIRRTAWATLAGSIIGTAALIVPRRWRGEPRIGSAQREWLISIAGGGVMGLIGGTYAFGTVDKDFIHEKIRHDYTDLINTYVAKVNQRARNESPLQAPMDAAPGETSATFQDKVRQSQLSPVVSTPPL